MSRNDLWVFPVPVDSRPGEPNYGVACIFSPVIPATDIRFMFGFNKPYTPVPPPPPPDDGGSPNIVNLGLVRRQQAAVNAQGVNRNQQPFRRAA